MADIPGMSEGIEAVRILFQGIEMLLRLGAGATRWSMDNLIKLGTFLWRVHETKKIDLKEGEVPFSDLSRMGDTAVFQVNNSNKEHVIDYLQKAGVTYSILPDLNDKDDCFEIAYLGSQDVAIKNYIAKCPDAARTYTYAEYHNNANEEMVEKTLTHLNSDAEIKAVSNEIIKEDYGSVLKNDGYGVEVNTSLIDFSDLHESENVKVAIPNQKNMYIEVNKQRLFKAEDGDKKYLNIAFKPNEMFVVVDSNGKPTKLLDNEGNTILDNNGKVNFITVEQYENAVKNMTKAAKGKTSDSIIHFSNTDRNGIRTSLTKTVQPQLPKLDTPKLDMGLKVKAPSKGIR